jgi:hypothetical protein
MGEAKQRGTFRERREAAQLEGAEILICLTADDGKVKASFIPRDAEPDQNSQAMILAGYISANLHELLLEAVASYQVYEAQAAANAADPGIVTDAQPRIAGADGSPAQAASVLLGPDGRPIQ